MDLRTSVHTSAAQAERSGVCVQKNNEKSSSFRGPLAILAGILVGLGVSFGLTRLIATLLYGVTPTDGLTFASVTALLVLIALLACWLPALRASRVDPLPCGRWSRQLS